MKKIIGILVLVFTGIVGSVDRCSLSRSLGAIQNIASDS